jgi:osmotically-inducible protein OsmY
MHPRLILVCACLLLLNGCAGVLLSAGTNVGVAVAQNRSLGRTVDDNVIYGDLTSRFVEAKQTELLSKVTFNVRFARVMLTGTVENEEQSLKAVELSWKAKGVSEVINELVVDPSANFFDKANDSIIKRNLEGRFFITKGVWVINYSIDVQNGVAYLIGRVKDKTELDLALNVARTTRGIKRVVSHLQIDPKVERLPQDEGQPESNPAPTATQPAVNSVGSSIGTSGGGEVYTGPVYGGGTISSSPN